MMHTAIASAGEEDRFLVEYVSIFTRHHGTLVGNNVLPNCFLLGRIDYGLVGVARERAEVSYTTTTCQVELLIKKSRWIGDQNNLLRLRRRPLTWAGLTTRSGRREIVGARFGPRIVGHRRLADVTNPSTAS